MTGDGPGGPAVAVSGLRHAFGETDALAGVSLTVPAGSFVSIVGPSGCGKSTLLRVLAGLLVPVAGAASVAGVSAVGRPGLVGYMPQRDLLVPWKRALDNACLAADLAHGSAARREARRRARELFERFGLAGFEQAWPSTLSGGMRQRLALLRTYLTGRRVLLLDEPFGALDAITRRDLHVWLQSLWSDAGIDGQQSGGGAPRSVLLVTHDVEEALFLSDTVHVMSGRPGRLIESVDVTAPRPRPPDIVTSAPFTAHKAALLQALDRGR